MAGDALASTQATPHELRTPGVPRTFDEYRHQLEAGAPVTASIDSESAGDLFGLLAQTWKLSLELVNGSDRAEVVSLLDYLSCFADAPIPVELLLRLDLMRAALPQLDIVEQLRRDLRSLESVGLLRIEAGSAEGGDPTSISMIHVHRLVRRCCRAERRSEVDGVRFQSNALLLIDAFATAQVREVNDWRIWAVVEPHIFHISDAMTAQPGFSLEAIALMCKLGTMAAKALQACGAYDEAEKRLRRMEALQKAHLPASDDRHLELSEAFASLARRRGDLATAMKAYNEIYGAYLLAHGQLHRKTIRVGAGLAGVLHQAGNRKGAAELLDSILIAARESLGDADRQTLALKANVACLMYEMDSWGTAEAEIREVLTAQQCLLGEQHEDTVRTRLNLAQMYRVRGAFDEAAGEYAAAIRAFNAVYGVSSAQSLTTRTSMAGLLRDRGMTEAAEASYRAVLTDAQRYLGADHLVTQRVSRRLDALLKNPDLEESGVFRGLAAVVRAAKASELPAYVLAGRAVESGTNFTHSSNRFVLSEGVPENHSGTLNAFPSPYWSPEEEQEGVSRRRAVVGAAILLVLVVAVVAGVLLIR
jgi:tetratricopeptide (TPR) repeat protein